MKCSMHKVKTVSFDCGGTLLYEIEKDHVIYYEILRELGYDVYIDGVKEALKDAQGWCNAEMLRMGKIWNEEAWIEMLKKFVSNLKLSNQEELAVKLYNTFIQRIAIKAYEDAKPTIMALKQMGIQTIVISNVSSERNLKTYLSKAGLVNCFDVLVASGSIGYEKPSSEIFREALRLSKTSPEEVIHVGDKYEEDYVGARSAGMKSVLLDREGTYGDKVCIKISKLTELLALI